MTFAPDGGASICAGGFNPYLAGSLSSECAHYIAVDGSNSIQLRQSLAEASVTGPVIALPAGDLSVAIGFFHKRDEFDYDADAALSKTLPDVPARQVLVRISRDLRRDRTGPATSTTMTLISNCVRRS